MQSICSDGLMSVVSSGTKKADDTRLPLTVFLYLIFAWDSWDNGTAPVLTSFELSQPVLIF